MISLEKIVSDDIKRIRNDYERMSKELSKLDTRKPNEAYLYSHLVRKMVKLKDSIDPLMTVHNYMKTGNGIQEDDLE